ncbi:hypothetical protein Syun_018035 [Stephania yunnanensis]|uniref:Uncharacterized protein n=1 Tax=Stephania yunnanensis TaxID=152371 RepID=A0AAP0IRJ1_9MAGN
MWFWWDEGGVLKYEMESGVEVLGGGGERRNDAALAINSNDAIPKSDVNREYFTEEHDRKCSISNLNRQPILEIKKTDLAYNARIAMERLIKRAKKSDLDRNRRTNPRGDDDLMSKIESFLLRSEEAGLYGWRGRAKVLEKRTQKAELNTVGSGECSNCDGAIDKESRRKLTLISNPTNFRSLDELWAFYMSQHSKPSTRRWHFAGTLTALLILISFIIFAWWVVFFVPIFGYGLAWYNHFFVEGNVPTTFGHPIWSLMCDFKMFGLMLIGRMDGEIKRLGKRPVLQTPFNVQELSVHAFSLSRKYEEDQDSRAASTCFVSLRTFCFVANTKDEVLLANSFIKATNIERLDALVFRGTRDGISPALFRSFKATGSFTLQIISRNYLELEQATHTRDQEDRLGIRFVAYRSRQTSVFLNLASLPLISMHNTRIKVTRKARVNQCILCHEFRELGRVWAFYMSQHSKPSTRRWHFAGTLIARSSSSLPSSSLDGSSSSFPFSGTDRLLWYNHFFVEGNVPRRFGTRFGPSCAISRCSGSCLAGWTGRSRGLGRGRLASLCDAFDLRRDYRPCEEYESKPYAVLEAPAEAVDEVEDLSEENRKNVRENTT